MEFIPINKSTIPKNDLEIWHAKYIYPSNILMTEE